MHRLCIFLHLFLLVFTSCKFSLYPKLCHALAGPLIDPIVSGRIYLKLSVEQSRALLNLLGHHVSSSLPSALDDCRELVELNADFLEKVDGGLGGVASGGRVAASHVTALMSAVVTNLQTCLDGLAAETAASRRAVVGTEIYALLGKAMEAYDVSMELVAAAASERGRGGIPKTAADVIIGTHVRGRHLLEELQEKVPSRGSVVVAKDGSGDFETISEAIDNVPDTTEDVENGGGYYFVTIKEGVYEENVVVSKGKRNLVLLGDGIDKTVLVGNRSVVDGWSTFNSATFAVNADHFVAVDITFVNTAGPEKHQAVAVRNSADLSTFYRCSFEGYQDTLYAHSLRQFYRECDIYGTIDFIFGNAATVLQNCNMYARPPLPSQNNVVTAQGRSHPNQTTGISIHNCTVSATWDLNTNSTRTYLGRPWKEYSRTVYMQSYIDGNIEPEGWMEWNGSFALDTLFYGEFGNTGPRSDTSGRVRWPGYSLMDVEQAFRFTVYNFTAGDAWLPYTSVPYNGGLL